jgi:hypothetical protein
MSKSLTQGVFYLKCATDLFDATVLDVHKNERQRVRQWVNKLNWIMNDIYDSLTPDGKEAYKAEIKNGDPILFGSVIQLMLKMDTSQREMLESVASGIARGEIIEYLAAPTENL